MVGIRKKIIFNATVLDKTQKNELNFFTNNIDSNNPVTPTCVEGIFENLDFLKDGFFLPIEIQPIILSVYDNFSEYQNFTHILGYDVNDNYAPVGSVDCVRMELYLSFENAITYDERIDVLPEYVEQINNLYVTEFGSIICSFEPVINEYSLFLGEPTEVGPMPYATYFENETMIPLGVGESFNYSLQFISGIGTGDRMFLHPIGGVDAPRGIYPLRIGLNNSQGGACFISNNSFPQTFNDYSGNIITFDSIEIRSHEGRTVPENKETFLERLNIFSTPDSEQDTNVIEIGSTEVNGLSFSENRILIYNSTSTILSTVFNNSREATVFSLRLINPSLPVKPLYFILSEPI